jgi:LacI family transcriptional regulator
MAKSVRLIDIAKKLGVSNVTVSKALADKDGVSEEMRQKIKALAAEMGYKPASVSKPKTGTGNIGVLIPSRFIEKAGSFYWTMYEEIITKLSANGYYGIIEKLTQEDEDSKKLPKMIQDHKVDGVIIIGQTKDRYLDFLWNSGTVPIMCMDHYNTHMEYDTVISDGYYGMYVLTNYLIKMGHKDIAFVGTPLATSSITDRYFGYQKALLENGIKLREEWIIPDRVRETNICFEITLPEKMPTAFACNSDFTASMLIKKLVEKGLSVPKDVSVVGFDDYLFPNVTDLKITSYAVDMDKMAGLCVKTLLKKIKGKDYVKGVQIVTGHMVIKESVKNLNARNSRES